MKTISTQPIPSSMPGLPELKAMGERRARLPQHEAYAVRLARVRDALFILQRHGIDVIDIDINRPKPVISIPYLKRNAVLGTAVPYQFGRDTRGRIRRLQIQLEGCRVEWDEAVN
ncbi:hypothetical protein A9404_00430 [Halothiobacillus diazotrophicus]|uniref:Uncharacterized protein n=1 Tax=Halothiobacillus diazotrophicus TaxID=1860122 RepID=A0A191ZDU8_9GAMM|nr:hypothetical protein [Halothiobacillus diazotrophicus]ANJ66046.1 hypothetical protein A9404_00430 [Halothiobacillus diazotrophicus]